MNILHVAFPPGFVPVPHSVRRARIRDLIAEERKHPLPFLRSEFEGEPSQSAVAKMDAKSTVYEGGKLEIRSALDE